MTRIKLALASQPALVGILAIVATLILSACNGGAGGDSPY